MLRAALEGEQPVLFSELAGTWMCSQCKRKTLFELFWLIQLPGTPRQERSEPA